MHYKCGCQLALGTDSDLLQRRPTEQSLQLDSGIAGGVETMKRKIVFAAIFVLTLCHGAAGGCKPLVDFTSVHAFNLSNVLM